MRDTLPVGLSSDTVAGACNVFDGDVGDIFIFTLHYHVMQYDSCVDDIGDITLVEESRRTFDQCKTRLEHTESLLHILSRRLLPLGKITPFLLSWTTNRLHENGPTWVYVVRQVIPHLMLVAVRGEVNQGAYSLALVVEQRRGLQDI